MLKESGNLIEEGIPITKELLDFAKANNYKISLKTGDYRIGELKANRAKNNPMLMDQIGKLYLGVEYIQPNTVMFLGWVKLDLLTPLKEFWVIIIFRQLKFIRKKYSTNSANHA